MKKPLLSLSLLFIVVLLFESCGKEKSVESGGKVSQGSLQADGSGDCLPKTVTGIYEVAKVLSATTHYIDVQLNVTEVGSYLVYTDTINGIFFRTSGIFTSTGTLSVRLKGSGTPAVAGVSNFTVKYGATECAVSVTILPVGGSSPAVFSLSGTPNLCTTPVIAGDYIAGVALTGSNTVQLKVNVSTAGIYNITTVVSNGIVFSGTGSLLAGTGQTITLTASGTPLVAGSTNIPVTAGTSNCNFSVTVVATPPAMDYFPRTAGSNWSYEIDGDPDDSALLRAIAPTATIGGNVFNVFESTNDASQGFDSAGYFRKSGGNYSRFENLENYLGFDAELRAEFIFLKDDQAVGHTWYSNVNGHTGTFGGTPITIRIVFKILEKDVAKTVRGIPYTNVIAVEEKYEIKTGLTTWTDATSVFGYYKDYYARNVGWILDESFDVSGSPDGKFELRRSQIAP
jgi:hypothetical protein